MKLMLSTIVSWPFQGNCWCCRVGTAGACMHKNMRNLLTNQHDVPYNTGATDGCIYVPPAASPIHSSPIGCRCRPGPITKSNFILTSAVFFSFLSIFIFIICPIFFLLFLDHKIFYIYIPLIQNKSHGFSSNLNNTYFGSDRLYFFVWN